MAAWIRNKFNKSLWNKHKIKETGYLINGQPTISTFIVCRENIWVTQIVLVLLHLHNYTKAINTDTITTKTITTKTINITIMDVLLIIVT